MKEVERVHIADLIDTAKRVLDFLKKESVTSKAKIILLKGGLGAGKTTFVKSIGEALGVAETINSPTYVLKREYETKDEVFKNLIHIDAYRIDDIREAKILKLEDDMKNGENLIVIEWPEKIEFKKCDIAIDIKNKGDEEERHFSIDYAE